tara:strand:- start:9044 stop:9760 length:717 start_codon:yes stop_codon:yes gene_type:complete
MATFVQTNVGLYWGGYSLASTFNAIGLNLSNSLQDDTVYGDTFQSNAGGLSSVSLEGEGYWDSTNDSILESSISVGAAETVVTVTPVDQAAGSPAIFSKITTSEYNPFANGTVGEMLAFRVSGEGRGEKAVSGEIFVTPGTTRTTSGTSLPNQLGAVTSTQGIYSALHVLSASGTLDVVIKSDSDISFGSPDTRITHTQFTAIGAEMLSQLGTNADTWWRADFTISGSFDFIVSLAII